MMKTKKLSKREIQVLNEIARGLKNKEIAEIHGINEKTVSTYKARLMRKLNIDSKDNEYLLIQEAKNLGYLDAEEHNIKYTNEQLHTIMGNMEKFGGSFVKQLSNLIRLADAHNTVKLYRAFPDYFEKYLNW